jgi:FAD-dependent urate hydroxylase
MEFLVASSAGLDTEAVVIGAGPYGLSVAAHLSAAGVSHEVFGEPMQLWSEHMPAGMYLKSEGFASNISDPDGRYTLERFCDEHEHEYRYARSAAPIPLDTFVRYGLWFQDQVVPGLRREQVVSVGRVPGGFQVRLGSGETLRAASVVVASGMSSVAYVPPTLADLPPDLLTHTYDCTEPARYAGEQVAVLGAGQSALEAAALLHEHGAHVRAIVRASRLAWNSKPVTTERSLRERWRRPVSGLGDTRGLWVYSNRPLAFHRAPDSQKLRRAYKVLGPAGAWWLRPRIEDQFPIMLGRQILAAEVEARVGVLAASQAGAAGQAGVVAEAGAGGVRLRLVGPHGDEEQVSVAKVIAGTGYRPDVGRLRFIDPHISHTIATCSRLPGTPLLDSHFQSSVPGLHFVGYLAGFSFGPVMRFVYGADFAARRLARKLAR